MLTDRYGLGLTTANAVARDAYQDGQDLFLAADARPENAFARAIDADPGFALAHAGLARSHHVFRRMDTARAAIAQARACLDGASPREAAHVTIFEHLIAGRTAEGYTLIRAHLRDYPRDAMIAQTCLGVFSLIGFSGQPGREADALAFAEGLAPHYGDDWWFLAQLAFARSESGRLGPATADIERACALYPRNANAAHYRAHLHYELGESVAGRAQLRDWMQDYDRAALMHCHNSWHLALWALASGDADEMWQIVDRDLVPETSESPAINVLTDLAALYHRAEMAGLVVPADRWQALSRYAAEAFPEPGIGFVDIHAALAHAMAGRSEALQRIVTSARGPAADMVAACSEGFGALARGDWPGALLALTPVMADHARLGGSRAQRDLIEFAMLSALLRLGRTDEARRLAAMRRPMIDPACLPVGLRG